MCMEGAAVFLWLLWGPLASWQAAPMQLVQVPMLQFQQSRCCTCTANACNLLKLISLHAVLLLLHVLLC